MKGGDSVQDKEIIELYFSRDESAITETDIKYGKLCRKISFGILGNNEDSEECINTSYFKVWNAIPPGRPDNLCGYVCRVVKNTALSLCEKLRRKEDAEIYTELDSIVNYTSSIETRVESNRVAELINSFLSKQSQKNRTIFIARYYYNMPFREIAETIGITENAAKLKLSRMRKKLSDYLIRNGVEI